MTSVIPQTAFQFLYWLTQRHKWLVGGTLAGVVVGYSAENLAPYLVKRLIDAISAYTLQITQIWLWGLSIFLAYALANVSLRLSGFLGAQTITTIKAECYRLFMRYLVAGEFNDEPGLICNNAVLIGESAEAILQRLCWNVSQTILQFGIHLVLALTVNPLLFVSVFGWIALHLISNFYLAQYKQRFATQYAQSTNELRGRLVNFCRELIYRPEQTHNQLSEEMFTLDKAVELRTHDHLLNWRLSEAILLFYNLLHGFFMILALILILVLWQDKLIGLGDIAMSVSIILSTQKLLQGTSALLNELTEQHSFIGEGLRYIHTKHRKGLHAPKFF